MPRSEDIWLEHRRKLWMRPDAHRWLRPDAHRWLRQDWQRFAPPGRKDIDPLEFLQGKYSPGQPRVPAGHSDGGQWTSGASGGASGGGAFSFGDSLGGDEASEAFASASLDDGYQTIDRDDTGDEPWEAVVNDFDSDGTLDRQLIVNRDGSAIRSDFANDKDVPWDVQHIVLTPDGQAVTFQNEGLTQTVYDGNALPISKAVMTSDGAGSEATLQPVFALSPSAPGIALGAVTTLYGWLSSQNAANQYAILAFRAREFAPDAENARVAWTGNLTKDQVYEACPRYPEVQSITDESASVLNRGDYRTAAEYGTAVHFRIKELINGRETTPPSGPRESDFRAEVSILKSEEVGYGRSGSIRIDVLENTGRGTVCVYDIKTGEATLGPARMLELARTVSIRYPYARNIIVTEVKPRR